MPAAVRHGPGNKHGTVAGAVNYSCLWPVSCGSLRLLALHVYLPTFQTDRLTSYYASLRLLALHVYLPTFQTDRLTSYYACDCLSPPVSLLLSVLFNSSLRLLALHVYLPTFQTDRLTSYYACDCLSPPVSYFCCLFCLTAHSDCWHFMCTCQPFKLIGSLLTMRAIV
ncbi:hypothetical protein J6590_073901 [Homalodisca vitripennis]|nr:hypothetical protein J6590_073901 [Homalodisca vitripennis]